MFSVSVILEQGEIHQGTEQSWGYEWMTVHGFEKFSLTLASRFDGGMCRMGWAVPAKPAEDSSPGV